MVIETEHAVYGDETPQWGAREVAEKLKRLAVATLIVSLGCIINLGILEVTKLQHRKFKFSRRFIQN